MTTYIGFYHLNPDFAREVGQRVRAGELTPEPGRAPDPHFSQKVREFPTILPAGCKLIGSYSRGGYESAELPTEQQSPGIMILETDNAADPAVVTTYYLGYLVFAWYPYTPVART